MRALQIAFAMTCLAYSGSPSLAWDESKFEFEKGRLVVPKPTKKALTECRRELAQITDTNVIHDKSGGILLDCHVVERLHDDHYGQPIWNVAIDHVYDGKDSLKQREVKLVSPTLDSGGVLLENGKHYRIFAIDFEEMDGATKGNLYIWGTSVLELK